MAPPWVRAALRAVVVLSAATAYALPMIVGALAEVSHGTYHLLAAVREQKQRAAAFGVVHLSDARHAGGLPGSTQADHHFTHKHGGVTHSHDATTDALLAAAERTDPDPDGAPPPLLRLVSHLPAVPPHVTLLVPTAPTAAAASAEPRPNSLDGPPVPPPRA